MKEKHEYMDASAPEQSTMQVPPHFLVTRNTLIGFADPAVFWRKLRNTYLQAYWLWPLIVRDHHFDRLLHGEVPRSRLAGIPEKLLWFWPRIVDATVWARGAQGTGRSPLHYVDLDRWTEWAMSLFAHAVGDTSAKVSDLGCNSGRHLDCLHRLGFRNLYGVDVMGAALRQFEESFPATYASTTVEHDLFQRYLSKQPDLAFDATYAFGCTIELAHPSFPMVREICRVTRDLFMGVMHEHSLPYPRFWIEEFRRNGFDLVFAIRPVGGVDAKAPVDATTSLLIFRRARRS